jgi:hypothetical protein
MSWQCRPLTTALGVWGWLACVPLTYAHRLEAEFRVLPGRQIQVEAWFDATRAPAKGAKVSVYQGDRPLTTGQMNEHGTIVFSYEKVEDLRVVVDAGTGHRSVLRIPVAALKTEHTDHATPAGTVSPWADRTSRISIKDVLLGLAFLLALGAFALSWRNARLLRELRTSGSRGRPPGD